MRGRGHKRGRRKGSRGAGFLDILFGRESKPSRMAVARAEQIARWDNPNPASLESVATVDQDPIRFDYKRKIDL